MTGSEVVLVRHATTPWSSAGRHTSRTEIDLDATGCVESIRLRAVLSSAHEAAVFSSPRRRAIQTCALAGLGQRMVVTEDLAEWDYGEVEGLTTAQIRATRSGWSLFGDGSPGGETLADVASRADRVIGSLREGGPARSVLFSHGHFLRVLAARWAGLDPDVGAHLRLAPAAVCVLGYERETPVLRRWNWTSGPVI